MLGKADVARPLLAEARRLAPTDGDVAYTAATGYEAVGERDAALAAIGAALSAGYDRLEIESDTGLERLRADPRYAKLVTPLVPEPTATTGKSRERTTP